MYISTKMRAYRKDFEETKYMLFLIKDTNYQKNIMKFGEKLKMLSKWNFVVNQYIMKNT